MSAIRRMMMRAGKTDPYAGWVRGRITGNIDVVNLDDSSTMLCSPVIVVLHNIRIKTSTTDTECTIYFYDNSTGATGQWGVTGWYGQKERDVFHMRNYDYMRCEVTAVDIDDCFVYDKTTGEYLFAGKNVDTSVPPT